MTISGITLCTVRLLDHKQSLTLNCKVERCIGRRKGTLCKLGCNRTNLNTKSNLSTDRFLISL